jgi:hypothetical protein
MESKNIPLDGNMAEGAPSLGVGAPSGLGGASLGLLATLAAGAYIAGRFSKKESESPLPSLGRLAMTYVVFRGLDLLWPEAFKAVTQTTLPGTVGGISQAFKSNMSGLFGTPQTFRHSVSPPGQRVVDGYTVK